MRTLQRKRGMRVTAGKISKVLVANRGAIARRVIRACNELGIQSVAVFSDADGQAPYLQEASQTVHLPGTAPQNTYLNQTALLAAVADTGSDAVHPGYGFLSENADFALAVQNSGATFIGPKPDHIDAMGNKVAARARMAELGLPVFPGSPPVVDLADAESIAAAIGYPVLLKPSGGGGGMGMERVDSPADLPVALSRAQSVAQGAFASPEVYFEKLIEAPRHIEFQILGDLEGRVVHAFERDCSVQRRNQKLIEESPAPGIEPEILEALAQRCCEAAQQIGYSNVGTIETLYGADGEFGFLEMNTRIQVEHGVTEAVTGLDLVQLQIQLAEGAAVPSNIERSGYAIEGRIYAEQPDTFMPSTGRLTAFDVPALHNVRVETGYQAGQSVTPYYDAMLAKVIASGSTREMAIGRLLVALKAIEVRGVTTNQARLVRILESDEFLAGRIDTSIVERI